MNARPVRSASMAGPVVGEWSEVSPQQHALWLMYQMRPSLRGSYNIAFTARVESGLDADRLAHALEVLIARHPMLRARFAPSATSLPVVAVNLPSITSYDVLLPAMAAATRATAREASL